MKDTKHKTVMLAFRQAGAIGVATEKVYGCNTDQIFEYAKVNNLEFLFPDTYSILTNDMIFAILPCICQDETTGDNHE